MGRESSHQQCGLGCESGSFRYCRKTSLGCPAPKRIEDLIAPFEQAITPKTRVLAITYFQMSAVQAPGEATMRTGSPAGPIRARQTARRRGGLSVLIFANSAAIPTARARTNGSSVPAKSESPLRSKRTYCRDLAEHCRSRMGSRCDAGCRRRAEVRIARPARRCAVGRNVYRGRVPRHDRSRKD